MRNVSSVAILALVTLISLVGCSKSNPEAADPIEEAGSRAAAVSAEEILQLASVSLAASPTLRFDFRIEESHGDKTSLFVGEGLTASMEGSRRRIRLDGLSSDPNDESLEPAPRIVVDDGVIVTVVDHHDGVEWGSPLYRAGGILFQVWSGKFMNSLAAPEVLPALVGLGPTVLEDRQADGVLCHVLEMPIPGGVIGTVLVGKEDGLPRRAILEAEGFRSQTDLSGYVAEASEIPLAEFAVANDPGFDTREFTLGGPAPGTPAPDFELEAADGSTVTLAELSGKVVILDFWATWCIPCRASMVEVQELYSELGDRPFEVVSVTYQEAGDPAAMIEELGITYPWYNGDAIAAPYGVPQSGLPSMFLIGPDGKVLDYFYGYTGEESAARLRAGVETALAAI